MYQNPEPNDEILECFDEKGNRTEPHTRQEIHTEPIKYWHGVANIWIVNPKAQLLCSKRAETLSGNPGKWQTYFGGHVKAGITFQEAAALEMDEEIGLHIEDDGLHFIIKGTHAASKHFFESYVYLFLGDVADLTFNDGEITEVQWMDMDTYWQEKERHPEQWCNSCGPENQEKIKQFLQENGWGT